MKRIKQWVARILVFSMMITSMSIYYVKEINAADYTDNGCVRWVKERTKSKLGITLPGTGVNKYNLYGANNYWYTLNYNKGSEPKENSLAVWEFNNGSDGHEGKCGHVAFVESVNGNNVTVTEGGCIGYSYDGNTGVICRTQDKSQMPTLGGCSGFLGYVYLVDSTPIPNPEKINRYNVNEIATNSGLSITPGDYRIVSALDSTYGIDIQGGSSESGANVQLYQNLSSWDQIYTVISLGNGYYKIMNKELGTVLDVKDGSIENGSNVQAYTYNDTDAQKWVIKDAGDGYNYEIVSKASGLCLDVNGGIAANNTNIQIYSVNNSAAQKWRFIPADELSTQTIKDGTYHIVSKLDESKGLDISGASKDDMANVGIYSNTNNPNQTFTIKYLDDGYYSIMFNYAGTYIDRFGNYQINGANIDVTTWNGTDAQKWIIKPDGSSGYYWIIGKGCAKCLDITSGITDDLTNVQLFSINGSDAQKWKFINADTTTEIAPIVVPTSTPNSTSTMPTSTPSITVSN